MTISAEHRGVLDRAPFFRLMPAAALDALAACAEEQVVPVGDTVLAAGKVADSLRVVLSGRLLLQHNHPERSEQTSLLELSIGAAFGRGAATGEPELVDHVVLRQLHVLRWPRARLVQLDRAHPEWRLLAQLATRLSLYGQTRKLTGELQETSVFRGVSPALIRRLLVESTLVPFVQGEEIFRRGDAGDSFYLVVKGRVAIEASSEDVVSLTSDLSVDLNPGDAFGEMSLLHAEPRNADAHASEDAELLRIDKLAFDSLCRQSVPFLRDVLLLSHRRKAQSDATVRRTRVSCIFNRTQYSTRQIARLLGSAIEGSFQERVVVLEVDPEKRIQFSTRTSDLEPLGSVATLEEDVEHLADTLAPDHVIVFCRVPDPKVERKMAALSATLLFLSRSEAAEFPYDVSALQPVQHVVVLPRVLHSKSVVRRGAVRARLCNEIDHERDLARLPTDVAESFHRIARAVTHRSVGLALSGGGAWGFAHHALLRRLAAHGVPVDAVSGVSFGSLAGAAFTARGNDGMIALEQIAPTLDKVVLLLCPMSTWPIKKIVDRLTGGKYLEELDIPFFPVAADILTGKEKVFRFGSVGDAVRASGAFPGVYGPAILERRRYVDGAIVNNVPATVLPEEGLDFIIASDVMQPPSALREEPKAGLLRMASAMLPLTRMRDSMRSMYVMMQAAGRHQTHGAHACFRPELSKFLPSDFNHVRRILDAAEVQAEEFATTVALEYRRFGALQRKAATIASSTAA